MATRTRKNQTPEKGMEMIMATTPQLNIEDAAQQVGCAPIRLLELFAERLGTQEPMLWDSVPTEHEGLLLEFKQQQDAFNSVRTLESETASQPLPEATEQPLEPPLLEEKSEAKPKRQRRSTSSLTKKKEESIADTRQAATQTNAGITETLTLLQAQQGLIDSSQAGSVYLTTYTANLTNVKGEGLTVIAAQMLQEIGQKSGFDPNAILQQVGVPLTPETQQKLQETMGQVLGKAQDAATQIQQTSWGNGYDLQAELTNLDTLMNSNN